MTRVVVITGGLSAPSATGLLGDRLAAAVATAIPEAQIERVDLRPLAHPLADALLTGFAAGELLAAQQAVAAADALVVVTPVFSGSYSGLFKTFFDTLEPESLVGKPVLIAATAGTERHSLVLDHALRPLFSYLRAVVVPTGVYAAASDWGTGAGAESALSDRIARAAGELAALTGFRARPGVAEVGSFADPDFGQVPEFGRLLDG